MHLVAIGGSDAGISAALRTRELDPDCDVTVVVADAYPNFSICGIPYYVSGEVTHWRNLAHRTTTDLEATAWPAVSTRQTTNSSLLTLMAEKNFLRTTPWLSVLVRFRCVLLSMVWPGRMLLVLLTGCIYFTQWVTPSQ
jgi:hypothetical protein